ncbi:hypothetical protein FCJ57_36955, partial [Burkholderia diffusa]|nr:hypothetical protein [Burkholderia diffusa]
GADLRHVGVGLVADACALGLMMAVAGSGTWIARWRSRTCPLHARRRKGLNGHTVNLGDFVDENA